MEYSFNPQCMKEYLDHKCIVSLFMVEIFHYISFLRNQSQSVMYFDRHIQLNNKNIVSLEKCIDLNFYNRTCRNILIKMMFFQVCALYVKRHIYHKTFLANIEEDSYYRSDKKVLHA